MFPFVIRCYKASRCAASFINSKERLLVDCSTPYKDDLCTAGIVYLSNESCPLRSLILPTLYHSLSRFRILPFCNANVALVDDDIQEKKRGLQRATSKLEMKAFSPFVSRVTTTPPVLHYSDISTILTRWPLSIDSLHPWSRIVVFSAKRNSRRN